MKHSYLAQPVAGKASMYSTNVLLEPHERWLGSLGKPEWGGGCWKEKGEDVEGRKMLTT